MASWWIKLKAVFTLRQFRVFIVRNRMVEAVYQAGMIDDSLRLWSGVMGRRIPDQARDPGFCSLDPELDPGSREG